MRVIFIKGSSGVLTGAERPALMNEDAARGGAITHTLPPPAPGLSAQGRGTGGRVAAAAMYEPVSTSSVCLAVWFD